MWHTCHWVSSSQALACTDLGSRNFWLLWLTALRQCHQDYFGLPNPTSHFFACIRHLVLGIQDNTPHDLSGTVLSWRFWSAALGSLTPDPSIGPSKDYFLSATQQISPSAMELTCRARLWMEGILDRSSGWPWLLRRALLRSVCKPPTPDPGLWLESPESWIAWCHVPEGSPSACFFWAAEVAEFEKLLGCLLSSMASNSEVSLAGQAGSCKLRTE